MLRTESSAAFPKAARVRKRPEYLRAQSTSSRVTSARFVFLFRASPVQGRPRLGIVVTRKVGPAVVRNRAKRVLREAFRLHWAALLPDGVDLVVIVRPNAGKLSIGLADVLAESTPLESLLLKRARAALHESS